MVLTLVGHPLSTCTRRVALVAKEVGIPYEIVPVDFAKGEHKSPEFLAKQPFGQVPYIDDDGFTLFESRAIGRYLAAKTKSPLLPTELHANAKFETAASIEYSNFDHYAGGIAVEKVFKKMHGLEGDSARAEEHWQTLQNKLKAYEQILGTQKYLAGDEVTLADLFHLPYGYTIIQAGYKPFETPNLKRWWNDISNRPSWQAVKDSA
ncbi:hypothetical protein M422DRAFT_783510 [Sphaerobolus stellatus SS14]|uniref:glutathione transferase n=1 Tax=Sphaerobolus stellatus (strain SS14) TaxID=990650 RepID=A0A0C9V478_SPHS4|nr:hypothetical protein M422DRAFT_783510 [Sphaerobolus stellatus SS14]